LGQIKESYQFAFILVVEDKAKFAIDMNGPRIVLEYGKAELGGAGGLALPYRVGQEGLTEADVTQIRMAADSKAGHGEPLVPTSQHHVSDDSAFIAGDIVAIANGFDFGAKLARELARERMRMKELSRLGIRGQHREKISQRSRVSVGDPMDDDSIAHGNSKRIHLMRLVLDGG
jgi:hypothetical protein